MILSSCCSAELKVSYGSEGTGCYLCAKCGKPCDAKEEKMSKRSESIVYDRDRLEAENAKLKAALKKAGEAVRRLQNRTRRFENMEAYQIMESVLSDPTMKRVMGEVGK